MAKVEKSQLVNAAKELNDVFGLDPEIDVKESEENLTELVKSAAQWRKPDDEFTAGTVRTLKALRVWDIKGDASEEPPVEEQEDDVQELNTVLLDQVEGAEKLKDLKDIARANDEFKAIRGKLNGYKTADELREDMLEILEDVSNENEEEPEPKPVVKKGVALAEKRSTSAERVKFLTPLLTKGTFTKEQLAEKMEKEFPDLKKSTIQTFLTDSKNAKYNKFHKLVIQDAEGRMSFKK